MSAEDGKCNWCGLDIMQQDKPFLIQAKVFCSQQEFRQYYENFTNKKGQSKKKV